MEEVLMYSAITMTVTLLACTAIVWAFSYAMVNRDRRLPSLLAQAQEGQQMMRQDLHDSHVMLLAHFNQAGLIEYERFANSAPQPSPVPGHGELDPSVSSNGQRPHGLEALAAYQSKLEEMQRRHASDVNEARFGALPGSDPMSGREGMG